MSEILSTEIMLPAVGQGVLAIECCAGDDAARALLDPVHDAGSAAGAGAERAMLAALDGSCRTPIAGFATLDGNQLTIEGLLLKPDGSDALRGRRMSDITDITELGAELGNELRHDAGPGYGFGDLPGKAP